MSRVWEPMILVIAKDENQLGDAGHFCCCDDAHLCHVRTQSVRGLAALPCEQLARLQKAAHAGGQDNDQLRISRSIRAFS